MLRSIHSNLRQDVGRLDSASLTAYYLVFLCHKVLSPLAPGDPIRNNFGASSDAYLAQNCPHHLRRRGQSWECRLRLQRGQTFPERTDRGKYNG